jgi:hypothetical protein
MDEVRAAPAPNLHLKIDPNYRGMTVKRILFAVFALIIFEGLSLAQDTTMPGKTRITPGTMISAEFPKTIDAKKVKAGDPIEAKTAVDLLSNGQVIIPQGSKISGHITEAKARNKESKDSTIGFAFDKLSMKDGSALDIQATIQAIGPAPDNGASNTSVAGGPIGSAGGSLPGGTSGQSSGGSGSSLNPNSQGVVGLKGLSLNTSGQASVVSSSNQNVHLEGGTQLILRIQ